MSAKKSLVLLTVDCLRADHVGFLGYSRPATPFIDSLAAESVVVRNAIVGGAPTYYSFPSLLASRSPLAMGRDILGLVPGETSLSEQLKKAGYQTAAFIAANPYLSALFGYDQGFDTFHTFLNEKLSTGGFVTREQPSKGFRTHLNRVIAQMCHHLGPTGTLYEELYFRYCQRASPPVKSLDALRPYPSADKLVDHACAWLASVSQAPFFLWLHFMDPHAPYYPPEEAMVAIGAQSLAPSRLRHLNSYWNRSDLGPPRLRIQRNAVMDLYDASIRWVDTQTARLVDSLKSLGVWDRCLFAFTADHGEEFLDHGGRFHPPSTMKEELIRVPLIVRIPGVDPSKTSDQPFSHLHLAPTLLDSMGLPVPTVFQGRSRWSEWQKAEHSDNEQVVIVESTECTNPFRTEARLAARVLCIRGPRHKMLLHFASETVELFDLQRDPAENEPLPDNTERHTRQRLLEIAKEHVESCCIKERSEPQVRARLRELRQKLPEVSTTISG